MKHSAEDVRTTGNQKGFTEIMSPGEKGGTREGGGGRKADGALRMECVSWRRFLEMDDCLEMVTRETPQTTDGEGMKSRRADSPGEVCQASEANTDLILLSFGIMET